MAELKGSDDSDELLEQVETKTQETSVELKESSPSECESLVTSRETLLTTVSATKKTFYDLDITDDVTNKDLSRCDFKRVYAKEKTFKNINFTHSNFTNCYFRNCNFVNCNFLGSIFKETNFTKSTFAAGCKFEYTHWDKTRISSDILSNCLPSWENVANELAQELRANFAQIGDIESVNKAAATEVNQRGRMLYDTAFSSKGYYRERSHGLVRIGDILHYIFWLIVDAIWGHGESPNRVIVCALVTIGIITLYIWIPNFHSTTLWNSLLLGSEAFWGLSQTSLLPQFAHLVLAVVRNILFALFMASLINRLSRR